MSGGVPNSTIKKWARLVDMMVELSHSDKMRWDETVEEDEVIAPLGDYIISIAKRIHRGNGNEVYIVSVRGSDGRQIESFNDEDLDGGIEGASNYYQLLEELMDEAKRAISGADKVIDELLMIMERDRDIPF
jgi:hypothetical protein